MLLALRQKMSRSNDRCARVLERRLCTWYSTRMFGNGQRGISHAFWKVAKLASVNSMIIIRSFLSRYCMLYA